MNIELPKTTCWICPEGEFKATCIEANQRDTCLKLIFEVHVNENHNVQYLAQKRYPLPIKPGSELPSDLERWLGKDFLKRTRSIDPSMLKGLEADLELLHTHNDNYPDPFVFVNGIYAPGTLVSNSTPSPALFAPTFQLLEVP